MTAITLLAVFLAALSAAFFLWSYGVYPRLIRRLARGRAFPPPLPARDAPSRPASIEVLLSAADEEDVIEARVENLIAQEIPDGVPYRVSIGCDGCRDRTADRARASGSPAVRVIEFPRRRGKAAVLNALVSGSDANLLVFTDANTRFDRGAVSELAARFADPAVGAACGRLMFEAPESGRATPEALFWDRETASKEAEGALGVCVGANGGIYAARRELVSPIAEDTTSMDDFVIPVRVARAGRRVVFAGSAIAREPAAPDVWSELGRRFRIGVGGGQVLRRDAWLWSGAGNPLLALAFFSRKAARWLAPVLALASATAALFSPTLRAAAVIVLAAASVLVVSARLRPRLRGAVGTLYYFAVLNVALALGVVAGLLGYSRAAWSRTARS